MIFLKTYNAVILRNIEQLDPNFALHSGTIQDMCLQIIIKISKIAGARSGPKIPEHISDPTTTTVAA